MDFIVFISLATKSPAEHVHSQGKVLGDRRVLYKYLNPNLISLGTEAMTDGKPSISIYFVDVVTGKVCPKSFTLALRNVIPEVG